MSKKVGIITQHRVVNYGSVLQTYALQEKIKDALYQGIPIGGYTKMIANLLDGIKVRLNTDYQEHKSELDALADKVVYTGPIDAYFDYKLGTLEYRSVRFETELLDQPNFQGNAAVNYTDRETQWTRIIEHKWFEFGKDENGNDLPKTIISREYSSEWKPGDEPYYPVNDAKNAVVCAVYNYEDHATEFQLIENREERDKSIGSKYMQSKPGKIYKIAEDWLINHPEKRLLFVGMGCQADGFRKFAEMKGFRERVWIVDIICHGSPSPRLWKEYAESAEKKYGKITYLTFKDKRNGWKAPTAYVTAGGQEHLIKDYVKVFYNQCALRLSCYECPYATTERKTDMTIGDFWHIEETIPDFYDEKGNSIFLIHTDRGEQLFETVKVKLEYRLSDTKQCWQANLEAPTKRSEQRDEFWNDYQRKGVDFVMKKYGTTPLKTKIKNKLVKLISIGGGQTLNPDLIYYVDYSERRAA